MLRKILLLLLFTASCLMLNAQQLTRFAVVDLPRVYTAFFQESRAVRQYEERVARVQGEFDRVTREIQDLRTRHADAVLRDDENEALRLEAQIHRRSDFLRDLYQTRTAELERERSRLMQSGSFLDQIHDEIRFIAEREGYTMVINMRDNNSIIWYSNTIDITDMLIQSLHTRRR